MSIKHTVLILLSLVYLAWSPLALSQTEERFENCPGAMNAIGQSTNIWKTTATLTACINAVKTQFPAPLCGSYSNGDWSLQSTDDPFSVGTTGATTAKRYNYATFDGQCTFGIREYTGCAVSGASWDNSVHQCVAVDEAECLALENNHYTTVTYQQDFPVVARPENWAGCVNGCVVSWDAEGSYVDQQIDETQINWYVHHNYKYTGGTCSTPASVDLELPPSDEPAGCPSGSSYIQGESGAVCISDTTGETVSETEDTSQPAIDPANPDDRLSDTVPLPDAPGIEGVTSTDVQELADGIGDDLTTISTGATESNLESFLDDITRYIWDAPSSSTCPLLSYSFAGITPTEQWTNICGWLVFARYLMDMMFGILTVFAIFYMFDKSAWMRRA